MSDRLLLYLSPEAEERGVTLKLPRALDAGFDLPSLDDVTVPPRELGLIRTGVHAAIPAGWVGIIRDRSSMALRGSATVAGVIDSSYRGEIKVAMHNLSNEPLELRRGERIAQCIVVPHWKGEDADIVRSLEDLGETDRGAAGFGSTGRR